MPLFTSEEEPLLTGTDADVLAFIDTDRCLVVDWRGSEEETLWGIQQWLPESALSFEIAPENSTGDVAITVRFQGREDTFTMPPRPQNNFRVLLRVGQMLAPEYAINLFRCTEGDDTHAFLLRSAKWWDTFRDRYPERYTVIFSGIEMLRRLWELDAPPKPTKPWWKLR